MIYEVNWNILNNFKTAKHLPLISKINLHSNVIIVPFVSVFLVRIFMKNFKPADQAKPSNKIFLFSKNVDIKRRRFAIFFCYKSKFHVVMFSVHVVDKKFKVLWLFERNKNVINISFIINRYEIFRTSFKPFSSMMAKKTLANVGPKGLPKATPSIWL